MCLAKVYLQRAGAEELVSEEVARVDVQPGRVTVSTLFGEQQVIEGVVSQIDFARSRIVLQGKA